MESNPSSPADRAQRLQNLQEIAAKILAQYPTPEPSAAKSSPTPNAPESPQPAAPASTPTPDPGSGNAAIDRCLAAHAEAKKKARAAGRDNSDSARAGKAAYLRAMPPLVGPQNVADFIACVMRGSIEDIIFPFEINQYLYAAQVANCVKNPNAISAPKRPQGRPVTAPKSCRKASPKSNSSINTPSES